MYRVASLSLGKRSVVLLATILIAVMGAFGVTQLKTELLPNIDFPVLTVITNYSGASPDVVDSEVTQPIVSTVRALPGVTTTQSTSSEGLSVVIAQFDYGTNTKDAAQTLSTQLGQVALPQGATQPSIQRINFNQFPIVQLSLTGANSDLSTLRQIAQQQYQPALSGVNGVGRIEINGGADDVVSITLDPAKLAATAISPQAVATAIQSSNVSSASGLVQSGSTTLPVRVLSQVTSLDQLRGLVVGTSKQGSSGQGQPVTLGDVANVEIASGASSGITRTNGQPSVAMDVYMSQGANTVNTANGVTAKMNDITNKLKASGVDVTPVVIQNQSDYIQHSINDLEREALLGAAFAIIVIFGFLLSVRSTLVTAVSIPMSMLVAFILLWSQGITLNIMTLGGLAVAVGRVVDDAIVVLESIFRHVQRGEDSRSATLDGVKEVALAITASTVTTIAVFLPLGFVGGIIGAIFRPFALTVTFALLASLVVALTVVPVLASYLIRKDKLRPAPERTPLLQRVYVPTLSWALRRPKTTLAIAAVLFFSSFALVPLIGTSFLPSGNQKIASIQVSMPAGTSIDATEAEAAKLETVIKQAAPVTLLQTQIGGSGLAAAFAGSNASTATMTVTFDKSINMNKTLADLRTKLKDAAGNADVSVANESSGFGGNTNSVQVTVQGTNYDTVSKVAEDLTKQIAGVQNLVNVKNDVVNAKPEVVVNVDADKAITAGTTPTQIASDVRQILSTMQLGTIVVDGKSYQLTAQVAGVSTSVGALGLIPVGTSSTPLGQIASINQGTGPVQIVRVDGDRAATISGTITTDNTGSVTSKVSKIVSNYNAPEGITLNSGGVGQQQGQAFKSMGVALIAAVLLVYIAMVASFGSLSTPFVILFSLPLAIVGVLAALALTGKTLGLPALIGLLMLIGIVVTNAIVLLELVLDLLRHGTSLDEALITGGRTRLRPILMTAIATILALVPLAFSGGGGAIIASDLAVVVIGGLLTSTFLTLVVIPVVFKLIVGRQYRKRDIAIPEPEREEVGVGV